MPSELLGLERRLSRSSLLAISSEDISTRIVHGKMVTDYLARIVSLKAKRQMA